MKRNYVEYVICDCPIMGRIVVRHYFGKDEKHQGLFRYSRACLPSRLQ